MVRGHDIAGIGYRAYGSDGDAEEAKNAGDHVGGLFTSKDTVRAIFCVRGGDLAGCDDAKKVYEEEVPLGRVGDLTPEREDEREIVLDQMGRIRIVFWGELEGKEQAQKPNRVERTGQEISFELLLDGIYKGTTSGRTLSKMTGISDAGKYF